MALMTLAIALVAVLFTVFFLLKKFFGGNKKLGRVLTEDPKAQEQYYTSKHQGDEKNLSLQDRIKLSWQFLTNIKDQVLKRFSQDDQQKLKDAGNLLLEYGMSYKHDIDLEIKQQMSHEQSITVDKAKDKGPTVSM